MAGRPAYGIDDRFGLAWRGMPHDDGYPTGRAPAKCRGPGAYGFVGLAAQQGIHQ